MPEPAAPPLDQIIARSERQLPRSLADLALHRPDPNRPPAAGEPGERPPSLKGNLMRRFCNQPIRVPHTDWPQVLAGTKRMYRTYSGSWHSRFLPLLPEGEQYPRPAVIYSRLHITSHCEAALAIILSYRQEPLGAISPEDLAAEGFEMLGQFKRYWKFRYRNWGYRPRDLVSVVELRPWTIEDNETQARWLLQHLFGPWLPEPPPCPYCDGTGTRLCGWCMREGCRGVCLIPCGCAKGGR